MENTETTLNTTETLEATFTKMVDELTVKMRDTMNFMVKEVIAHIQSINANNEEKKGVVDFFNRDIDDAMEELKEKYSEVYDKIYDYIAPKVVEHIEDYDLDEDVKERIAQDYINDNNDSVLRDCFNNLGSYEQRDFVKDCIDEL